MQHEDILSEVRSKHEIAIVRQIEIREQLTNELMKEHAHELTEIKRQHDVELKSSIDEGHHYCQDLWAKQDTLTTQLWEYMGEYERANDRNNEYKVSRLQNFYILRTGIHSHLFVIRTHLRGSCQASLPTNSGSVSSLHILTYVRWSGGLVLILASRKPSEGRNRKRRISNVNSMISKTWLSNPIRNWR